MLLALKDELIFNLTVPAKLQAYMAAEKPVIAMLNGEGAEIIKEANCGLVAPAGDHMNLTQNIVQLKNQTPDQRKQIGNNGLRYCNTYFDKTKCINNLCNILKQEK